LKQKLWGRDFRVTLPSRSHFAPFSAVGSAELGPAAFHFSKFQEAFAKSSIPFCGVEVRLQQTIMVGTAR
jgi:hypothetical protein